MYGKAGWHLLEAREMVYVSHAAQEDSMGHHTHTHTVEWLVMEDTIMCMHIYVATCSAGED